MYRVENKVMKGMPDVHYIDKQGNSGWIELKFLESWPKKVLSIGLRMNQSLWLTSYARNKGSCWVLLKVGRDYTALMKGKDADKLFRPSKKEFFNVVHWSKKRQLIKRRLGRSLRCYYPFPLNAGRLTHHSIYTVKKNNNKYC